MSTEKSEIETYFGRCRCCLNYGYLKNMWKKYSNDDDEVYGKMLAECYALSWENQMTLEVDHICDPCVGKLKDACEFRKLVIKSHMQLMQEIGNDIRVEIEVKTEESAEDDAFETVEVIDDDDFGDNQNEVILDTEQDNKETVFYQNVEYLEEEVIDNNKVQAESKEQTSSGSAQADVKKPKWPRKLPQSERNKRYLQYTADDIQEAIEAVRSNKMSRLEASQYYNVPRKTLAIKVRDNAENCRGEGKSKLSIYKAEFKTEIQLVDKATEAVHIPTKYRKSVQDLADEMSKHRDNIRSVLQCSNATMIKAHSPGGYTCCFCQERYPSPADLKRHNLDIHEDASSKAIHVRYVADLIIKLDITGLRCIICGARISSLELFLEHLRGIHNKTIHRDVKNYMIPFKFDTEKLECITCAKPFRYFKILSEHMNEHYRNFECHVCGRGFINKQALNTHSYRHQKNVGEFKCPHCPQIFDTRHKRSAHVRRVHLYRGKTRKCHICGEKFTSSPQVQNHMVKIHGAEPLVFNCDACDKSYNNSRSLNDHKKRYHLMIRPHKCTFCDMAFFSKLELSAHTVTHTKTKEFQCDICDKRFGTKCCLSQHMRTHYGIKRHKCERCDIRYAARSKWKLHMWKKHREVV